MKTIFVPMQLKCERQRRKLTLKTVTKETGITISQLSEIERGVTLPSIKTMLTLIDFYEIPVDSIFFSWQEKEWI